MNVDASSIHQSPMIIRFSYDGQIGSFRLDGFAQKKYEIVIKKPQPTTKVFFIAIDAQTGEKMKINEKDFHVFSTTAFKSNVLLLAGGKGEHTFISVTRGPFPVTRTMLKMFHI